MEAWVQIGLTVFGCALGSYIAITIKQAVLEQRVSKLEQEVGTDNSGLRARVQEHARTLAEHEVRFEALEGQRSTRR